MKYRLTAATVAEENVCKQVKHVGLNKKIKEYIVMILNEPSIRVLEAAGIVCNIISFSHTG